jgi:hypothetical protein
MTRLHTLRAACIRWVAALTLPAVLLPAALAAQISAPSTHKAPDFLQKHGPAMRRSAAACQVCHQQESCLVCHQATPSVAAGFSPAATGKAMGVQVSRHRPPSHLADWIQSHGTTASARPERCAGCHTRQDCLDCHRPNPAQARGFHPAGFLASHPAQAYSQQIECANCHNTGQFCSSCHQQAGLTAKGALRGGYHDANRSFLGGHGQAARQSLESCVTCHTESDCLACHRTFNPHGPGFDASRLAKKNPEMCGACHTTIPGGG